MNVMMILLQTAVRCSISALQDDKRFWDLNLVGS